MLIDGDGLTVAALTAAARRPGRVRVSDAAWARVATAHRAAADPGVTVYGQSTGLGANRTVRVQSEGHALRVLRSHVAGVGALEPDDVTRATLLVRLNQLAAGGSGVSPRVVRALARAVDSGALPTLHRGGSIGTGDLSALSELALTLAGERPWRTGAVPAVELGGTDGLALISSNAVTASVAALATDDLARLLDAAHVVAALSFVALRGSAQAYAAAVHERTPYAGQRASAALLRALIGPDAVAPQRLQDPFGLRALPQVHGSAVDALTTLADVLAGQLNAAAENPLFTDGQVLHHGQFHTASLARALDSGRAALHPVLALSTSRLAALLDPALTGLTPFLAAGPAASSGVMVLEYLAHDALAEVRQVAGPSSVGLAVLSRGLEEHASFATQSARASAACVPWVRLVLGAELVAAVRALRMAGRRPVGGPLTEAFALVAAQLDPETADRSLGPDVGAAVELLPDLAAVARQATGVTEPG